MAADDLIKLVVNQSLQSSVVQNVLYYKVVTDDPGGDNLADLASGFITQVINPKWRDIVTTELSFDCLSLQKVFPAPVEAVQEFPITLAGSKPPDSLPAMSSFLLQKVNNATAGVGKRGRIYIAGVPELSTKDGRVQNDALTDIVTVADAFEAEVAPAGGGLYKPAWAIRKPDAPLKGSITGDVEIDRISVLPRIATQRRRRTPIRDFTV